MLTETEAAVRLVIALLLGGLLGFERELSAKPAGLRTHMLVAEGAALFMVCSMLLMEQFSQPSAGILIDPSRIGSTIVTGVGFLGGGMILRSRDRVFGLTTAAGIWVAAAIGMLVGAGYYLIAIIGTFLAVATIVFVRRVERFLRVPEHARERALDELPLEE
ncbi:MAG: MgtC/SapB family protein [Thermomicrobium sp.]|nr:MgtC/SapB family protein [Thermomicrobium sp.]MDW8058733.1 MgtC/SapB family protein [Thermomicrobium sp.]